MRAAADGDAEVVRALLTEGTDVNATAERGQTALILAAIFGRVEIVSLLLRAGADVKLKDSLGLTATEWSVRRGFADIARLIANAPTRMIANAPTQKLPAPPMDGGETIRPGAYLKGLPDDLEPQRATGAFRGQTASEIEISPKLDEGGAKKGETPKAKLGAAGLAILRTRATQIAEIDTETETLRQQTTVEQSEGALTDELALVNPHAVGTVTLSLEPELPSEVEQSLKPVERETLDLSQYVPANQPALPTVPAAEILPAAPAAALANRARDLASGERCPKCYKVHRNSILQYCPGDTERLPKVEAPSFNQLPTQSSGRLLLWVLIVVTLGGAAFGTYRWVSYSPAPPATAVAAVTKTEKPAAAPLPPAKPLPVVGGALVGAELTVPDPEYPTGPGKDQSEGISGSVTVQVQVNRQGKVISAHVLNGPWPLRLAATKAATKANFDPGKLSGKSSLVTGTITYNFLAPLTERPALTASPAASPASSPAVTDTRTTIGSAIVNPEVDLPVSGDALAGTEINLPKAEYPISAKTGGVSGIITVKVRVNREGRVISWLTSAGDPRLRAAALNAAKKATFAPEKLPGTGEVVGTITYNFKL